MTVGHLSVQARSPEMENGRKKFEQNSIFLLLPPSFPTLFHFITYSSACPIDLQDLTRGLYYLLTRET